MTAPQPWFIHHIRDLVGHRDRRTEVLLQTTSATYRPCFVRAIGEPAPWTRWLRARILAAAFVLAGKAVAVQWPKDGELELALHGKPDALPSRSLRRLQPVVPVAEVDGDDTGDAA